MARLGRLDDWLAATALNPAGSAVRLSSCFPSMDDVLLVPPPRNLWPPPPSPKVRWTNARFAPLEAVEVLAREQPLNDNAWYLDGHSQCLLPGSNPSRGGPFRPALRSHAGVDRLRGSGIAVHDTACLEFSPGGGLWALVTFEDADAGARWKDGVCTALRLLADSGFGGERSIGWGRSEEPEFKDVSFPEMVLPLASPAAPPATDELSAEPAPPAPSTGYWLLSMFSPAADDAVDWQRGSYSIVSRGGRVESAVRSGEEKKLVRMVEEGSVLMADAPLKGAAPDVAPEGFPHPVFRAGFAVAVPVPVRQPERPLGAS
jgi:hypothetical protein